MTPGDVGVYVSRRSTIESHMIILRNHLGVGGGGTVMKQKACKHNTKLKPKSNIS